MFTRRDLAKSISHLPDDLTLAQAEDWLHSGRMSQREFDAYKIFWDWAAPRFADDTQYRFAQRHGWDMLIARREAFRDALGIVELH